MFACDLPAVRQQLSPQIHKHGQLLSGRFAGAGRDGPDLFLFCPHWFDELVPLFVIWINGTFGKPVIVKF
jgi:hypothetical protein